MEIILHNIPPANIEVATLLFGFLLGIIPRFAIPFRITIFMLQIISWWIKTHPTGKKMAEETGLDDKFYRLFGVELEKHNHLFNGHTEEPQEKLLSIGEAARVLNVHPQTLRIWDKEEKLKPILAENGYRKYRLSDLRNVKLDK